MVDALVDRRRKLAEAIAELPRDVLLTRGLDDLNAGLVAFFRLDPLVLNWGKKSFDPNRIDAGVGDGVNRGISEFIPFSGAPGLFDWRPSTHTASPPNGFVLRNELMISYSGAYSGVDSDPAGVRSDFDRQVSDLRKWVPWANIEVRRLQR